MNSAQKVIKYLAIAFGAFLVVTIISATLFGLLMVGSIITGESLLSTSKNLVEETITIEDEIENLNIELQASKLTIEIGEEFKIETKSEKDNYSINTKNGTLTIKEKKKNRFFMNQQSEITIYIPKDLEFNDVDIDAGVGETNIKKIVTENIIIDLGVGYTKIEKLISKETTKISGGVGKFELKSGEIKNLTLDTGVGESIVSALITGKSKIGSGVGKVELNIDGDADEYTIKTSVGIGAITLNGKKCSSDETYGEGKNFIDIDGGIGEIKVTTK